MHPSVGCDKPSACKCAPVQCVCTNSAITIHRVVVGEWKSDTIILKGLPPNWPHRVTPMYLHSGISIHRPMQGGKVLRPIDTNVSAAMGKATDNPHPIH